jgi:hypothetical protein
VLVSVEEKVVPLRDILVPAEYVVLVLVSVEVIVTSPPDSLIETLVPALNSRVSVSVKVFPPASIALTGLQVLVDEKVVPLRDILVPAE